MQNYFALLAIESVFDVDLSALEKIYFTKQREFHPDRQIGKSDAEKQKAILASMDINTAYQTLKDPLKRAQHLLALQDIHVNTDGKDTVKPTPELLMEMMTLREEVVECASLTALEKLEAHSVREHQHCIQSISDAFAKNDLQQAAMGALRLRYLEKLRDELRVIRGQRFKDAS
jgi:molecular chaperone HscB